MDDLWFVTDVLFLYKGEKFYKILIIPSVYGGIVLRHLSPTTPLYHFPVSGMCIPSSRRPPSL